AALSLAAAETNGVTAEYKINLLAPAIGSEAFARAEVLKPGNLTVARADVWDVREAGNKLVATALATMVAI
ncbi:MAG: PaaI family thioesterase, partial [Acidobacteriota bacterium]|nr:PaaI family thioesterase [Acidobacteriota bacterium]